MLIRGYQRLIAKYPIVTQVISAGALTAGGDVIAQLCIEKRTTKNYQLARTFRFFAIGTCFISPTVITWYRFLARTVTGTSKTIPIKMVFYDQLCFSPCFLTAILTILRTIEGATPKETYDHWKRDFIPIFITGLKVWPPVQIINFYLVPLNYRLLFVQTISLFWNTYLSYKTQCKDHENVIAPEDHIEALPYAVEDWTYEKSKDNASTEHLSQVTNQRASTTLVMPVV